MTTTTGTPERRREAEARAQEIQRLPDEVIKAREWLVHAGVSRAEIAEFDEKGTIPARFEMASTSKEEDDMVTRKNTKDGPTEGRNSNGVGPPANKKAEADQRLHKELVAAVQSLLNDAVRVSELARRAFSERIWKSMEYVSWEAYCAAEIQIFTEHMSQSLLTRINRELILEAGLSARAAGAVTGDPSGMAAGRDVRKPGATSVAPGAKRTGADGKRQAATKTPSTPSAPTFSPWDQILELLDLTGPLHQVSAKLKALTARGDAPGDDFRASVLQALQNQRETIGVITTRIERGDSLEDAFRELDNASDAKSIGA